MNGQVTRLLRKISFYTRESFDDLKKKWDQIPRNKRRAARKKIEQHLEDFKEKGIPVGKRIDL